MQISDLKYLLAYLGPVLVFLGLYAGGFWSYSAFLFAFFLVPVLELFLTVPPSVPSKFKEKRAVHPLFDYLLYINIPIVFMMVYYYALTISKGTETLFEIIGHTLGLGIFIGASGINVAHELGHRSRGYEIMMSKILLIPAFYQHFYIEHNRGHHRYVATPFDPATARYNETLYRFWIRSAVDGFRSAWKLEDSRLLKHGKPSISIFNQMIQFVIIQVIYLVMVFYLFGMVAGLLVLLAGIIGILMLESINYIEHYGLLRNKKKSGGFEKVGPEHSWNSNHLLGRILLYELTRHADHHCKASKKYQLLQPYAKSPQLPTGYPGSILLAMVPPLWFKVMN
ncbi:MAG: alkane 1-monooxygenase, partial [Saprospiraceae bacterium]|nr:alkane 1-monooxygenase [Saprospiraceae bacterium]